MAGGTEVARLAVRVVPNTRNFRQATEAGIKRQMKGFKVRIPVSPDTKGFGAKVKAAAKSAAAAASGNDVTFDADLDAAGLGAKAKAAAAAASGNKVTFTAIVSRAFDRISRQALQISEGLRRISKNARNVQSLTKTFNLFGRSVRKATTPVRTLGKALLSLPGRSELLRAYADDLDSYVFKPTFKRFDALQKKFTRPLRLRIDRGAAIDDMAQIRRMVGIEASRIQALQRSKGEPTKALRADLKKLHKDVAGIDWSGDWVTQVRNLQTEMSNLRRRIGDTTYETSQFDKKLNQAMSRLQNGDVGKFQKAIREIRFQTKQVGDNLRHSRIGESLAKDLQVARVQVEKLRNSARRIKDDFASSPLGFQMEQGLSRVLGKVHAIRDGFRDIGKQQTQRVFRNPLGGDRRRGIASIPGDTDRAIVGLRSLAKGADRVRGAFARAGQATNGFFKNFRQKYFQPDSTIGFIAAAIVAALAPVAGLVGSLLAGLPTLLASIGAAALVVALGFDGIKAAAEPLIAAIQPLKESLSGIFEEALTPQFEKLAGVIPMVTPALEQIATGLTDVSGAFVDAFTSTDNVEKLNTFLGRTADLFSGMAPGVAAFTDGFLTMFEGASRGYPAMAKVFNGFAELFKMDMSRLVDTGQMQAAMESLAVSTGALFVGLHRIFVAGIEQMPRMTEGFVEMFDGIADGLVVAMPALAAFSNAVGKGMGAAFRGLGKGIATLGQYLSSSNLGQGISDLIGALAPAFGSAASGVMEFAGVIGNELGAAFSTVSPLLAAFASTLSDKVTGVLEALAPAIPSIVSALADLVSVLLLAGQHLVTAFGPLVVIAAQALSPLIGAIAEVISWVGNLLAATSDIWGPILVGVAAVIGAYKLWTGATLVLISIKTALSAAIAAVRTAMWLLNAAFYANPIGFVVGLVIAAVAAFIYLGTSTEAGRAAIEKLNNELSWLRNILMVVSPLLGALTWLVGKINDVFGTGGDAVSGFSAELENVTSQISGVTNSLGAIPGATDMAIPGLDNLGTAFDGATGSAQGLAGAIPGVDAAMAQAGTTAQTMSWHVQGIGDAAMGAVPMVQESTQLFNDAFLNMLPGMAEAERRVHEMGVNMGTNIAGVATAVPGAMAPFHEEMFGIPLSADTAMNETTAILGAGLSGFALTNPDFVGPIKMQFDEIPRAADTAMSNTSTALSTGIGDAASSVQSGLAPIPGHVTETGSQMTTEMTTAMTNMNTGIQTGVDNAGQIASTLVPTVKGAIGDTNALHSSGLALGNSFAAGIRASIPAARAAAAELAAAVKANMPNSPAKEGPLSGKGYTDESGKALAKDFAGGIRSEVNSVSDAASAIADAAKQGVEQYHREINRYNHDLIYMPVMEGNARKIADYHKREAEAIERGNDDAEKALERRNKMLESLEVPDFRELNRSIQSYYIDGTKGMFNQSILNYAKNTGFSNQLRQVALDAVSEAREIFGDHPVMAQVEANVNAEHFQWSIEEAIKAADLGSVPIDLAIANLDQLKRDLGFGDGALTRGLQAVLDFNPNETDAYRYEKGKEEVHYHVTDLEEAMRLEDERRRRGALRYI